MFNADHAAVVREAHRVWSDGGDLYADWYARPRRHVRVREAAPGCPPLAGQLRVACSASWQPECRVVAVGIADTVVVADAVGTRRAVSRGDYWLPERPGRPARVGDRVVAVGRCGGYEADGWWRLWSAGWDATTTRPDLTRIYFSVEPAAAVALAGRLWGALSTEDMGWMLKIASEPAALVRPDAAVLYLRDADARTGFEVAARLADLMAPAEQVPFTRTLVPGISWSEDPGGEASFGERVCAVLAQGFAGGGEPVAAAEDAFVGAGLDPSRPHLRGGAR